MSKYHHLNTRTARLVRVAVGLSVSKMLSRLTSRDTTICISVYVENLLHRTRTTVYTVCEYHHKVCSHKMTSKDNL